MARHQSRTFGEVLLAGTNVRIGAVTTSVLARDASGNILICRGTTMPTDGGAGFSPGAIWMKTDTGDVYFNTGTALSCDFDMQGVVGSGSVTLGTLAAGITPSHVVKFGAANVAGADGAATLVVANAGFAATDIPVVTMRVNAAARAVVSVTMANGTMTIVWSGNVALTDTFDYVIFRAVA